MIMKFTIQNNFTMATIMAKSGLIIKVVYVCARLLQLAVESRDLSQSQTKLVAVKSWSNSQNDKYFRLFSPLASEKNIVYSACNNSNVCLSLRKITWFNSQLKQTSKDEDQLSSPKSNPDYFISRQKILCDWNYQWSVYGNITCPIFWWLKRYLKPF